MLLLTVLEIYAAAAVAFYTYIVRTAEEEPQEQAGIVLEAADWRRHREGDQEIRRAA